MRGVISVNFALLAICVQVVAVAQTTDPAAALYDQALARRDAGDYPAAIQLLRQAVGLRPDRLEYLLTLAETLSWAKQFEEAGAVYQEILRSRPQTRRARLGLARVKLWSSRYPEARWMFRELLRSEATDLAALKGLAQTEYWSGDFRAARSLFRQVLTLQPDDSESRQSLTEIGAVSRPEYRGLLQHGEDDQPFNLTRAEAAAGLFSDPLTRWDIAAGTFILEDRDRDRDQDVPYVSVQASTKFPAYRLAVQGGLRILRFPDDSTRTLGQMSLHREIGSTSAGLFWSQNELLSTVAAMNTHAYVTAFGVRWGRSVAPFFGVSVQKEDYFDGNDGANAYGYYLRPVVQRDKWTGSVGLAGSYRDVEQSRFRLTRISSTAQPSGEFRYTYSGVYEPYWAPHDLREARAVVAIDGRLTPKLNLKLQFDGGVARDRALAFGPPRGTTPLPFATFPFFLEREYHPWQGSVSASLNMTRDFRLDASFRHFVTVFYTADEFQISLARRR